MLQLVLNAQFLVFLFLLSFATTTACANSCGPVISAYVDFSEGGKPEYPKKNP